LARELQGELDQLPVLSLPNAPNLDPVEGEAIDWTTAQPLGRPFAELLRQPPAAAAAAALPDAAGRAGAWKAWGNTFKSFLKDGCVLSLWRSPSLGELSKPGEGERELRIRLAERARTARSAQLDAVRAKWAKRVEQAQAKVAKAQEGVAAQQSQLHGQQLQTAISVGATVLGALFGRKALSASSLGRATTAARGAGRTMHEMTDVSQAREKLTAAQAALADVQQQMEADLGAATGGGASPETEQLEEVRLLPKEVEVDGVYLLWVSG